MGDEAEEVGEGAAGADVLVNGCSFIVVFIHFIRKPCLIFFSEACFFKLSFTGSSHWSRLYFY